MVEQSDANDDRLRSALTHELQSDFMENIESTITDYVFIVVYRNMCVARINGKKHSLRIQCADRSINATCIREERIE